MVNKGKIITLNIIKEEIKMNKKKWMSILLCLVMVFTCITPVFADTATTWTAEDFTYGEESIQLNSSDNYSQNITVKKWVVTGLSDAGKAKFETNKDLVIPAKDPDGKVVQGVGKNAFVGKSSASYGIKSVTFPENVTTKNDGVWQTEFERGDFYIGYAAFRYNDIEELNLPEGVILLNTYAFANNTKLETVNFPKSIMTINSGAFYKCSNLKTLNFPDKTDLALQFDMTVFASTSIASAEMPSNILRIHKTTFNACPGIPVELYVSTIPQADVVGTQTQSWTFVEGKDPAKVTNLSDKVNLEYTEVVYEAGKVYKPEVSIEGLVEGIDYTFAYENNEAVGDAKVVIKGINNYYGELELEFAIKAAPAPAPTPSVPVTGDTAPMALMVALMAVAAAGGFVAYRKRNN